MNILVTGGAGYIGSHATRRLADLGHRVSVVDDLSHGHRAAVDGRATFFNLNTADLGQMTALLRECHIEAVMHFAAFIEVGESVKDPAKYYRNNVAAGLALLDAMRAAGVGRFIFSSTAATYGEPRYTPIDEEHPCDPINPYGRSKRMLELALADFAAAYGMGYTIFRYFNVAGAAPDHTIGEAHEPETHLIPRILEVAMGKAPHASIFGTDYPTPDGTCIRDFVHVEDLVEAHVLALSHTRPGGGGRVFNLGSEKGFSVREVIEACRRVTGHPIPVKEMPKRAGDPAVLVATSARIKAEWGWAPAYSDLDTIIRHAWDWHRTHPRGYGPAD